MHPYPPIIEYKAYEDGEGLKSAKDPGSADQSKKGATGCARSQAKAGDESPKAKVVKLTIKGGAVESQTQLVPDHAPIAQDDPKRPCFAPKLESGTISWQIESPNLVTAAIIQVFHRGSARALFVRELKNSEIEQGQGQVLWDGKVDEGVAGFPSGYIGVSRSPYKVKLTIHGEVDPKAECAWTYFDVLIESIKLAWGAYDLLEPKRDDIHVDYKEKILGKPAQPGVPNSKVVGLEEDLLNKLKAADPTPSDKVKHDVVLVSNLFAKRDPGASDTTELSDQTDFNEYQKLWGNGPRIPIVATVSVKKADGTGTTEAIEALAGATLLWDWQDNEPERWKKPLTPKQTPPMTEGFLDAAYHKNDPKKPASSCNAPVHFGGKLGSGGVSVFQPPTAAGVFPYKYAPCATRTWACVSEFPPIKTDGTAYEPGKEPYRTGVIFQPSRMAGDKYNLSVQLYFEPEFDSEKDIETTAPAFTKAGVFEVFRKLDLKYLVYGAPNLGCDSDACLKSTADLFLKEANIILDYAKVTIAKADYEKALKRTLDSMLTDVKLYNTLTFQNPLTYKYYISTDLPANSPPIVYRDKAYLNDLEAAFKAGRIQRLSSLENRNTFLKEKVTGKSGRAEGIVLSAKETKENSLVDILFEDPAGIFVDGEVLEGFASKATGKVKVAPQWDFWGVTHTYEESDDKHYDAKIDVEIGGTKVTLTFPREGMGRHYSPNVPETGKSELRGALPTKDRNALLTVKITSKRGPSTRAQTRLQNVKDYLASIILDRKAIYEHQRDGYDALVHNALGATGNTANKQFPQTVVPRMLQEYIRDKHPNDEAIFLLHIPGRTNIKDLAWTAEADKPFTEASLAGALFAAESTRHQGILYVSSLPPGPNVTKGTTKKLEAIFAHEIAHALFLPHAKHRTGNDPGGVVEKKHVKGDTCVMNYDLDSERFCGLCMIRLRGWKTDPGEFASGTDQMEYKLELKLGDIEELFEDFIDPDRGKMARLQALGLFARPLDHPEADACLAYAWPLAEKLFPALAGATPEAARKTLATEIRKFLVGGDTLPVAGQYARMHTPMFTLLYALNYLEAKISADEQGKPQSKPWEDFMLGANPRAVEEAYFKANSALGKIPLEVLVLGRRKGSNLPWDQAEPVRLANVFFELIDPALDAAPVGPATLDVAGATAHYTKVTAPAPTAETGAYLNINTKTGKLDRTHAFLTCADDGFKFIPWNSDAKGKAIRVTTDENGYVRVNFRPSMIAGDAYRFRVYVGPDTQDKPAAPGDSMVETGTLVHWRSLRISNHVRMDSPADAGGLPACLKQDGAVYSPNYAGLTGALPALDLKGHVSQEFAKSYVEVLLEAGAMAPTTIASHETDIRAEIATLLKDYPQFNRTSLVKGRLKNAMSIFRADMTASEDRKTFRVTLPGKAEEGTLTVRPKEGKLNSVVLDDSGDEIVVKNIVERHAVDYNNRTVEVTFSTPMAEDYQACFQVDGFFDVDKLLAPMPATSPFLFNLQLPKAYNAAIGAGTMPMALNASEKLTAHTGENPHFFALDGSTLGLVKGLLMVAVWRALGKNKGFSPGLSIVEAASLDNYTAAAENPGTQEGKAVGQCIFLFGGNGSSAPRYNALATHEISHGLYLEHAPGSPTAAGAKPTLHTKLRKLSASAPDKDDTPGFETEIPCVMSYDARSDGHHCGKCVANLRGVGVEKL